MLTLTLLSTALIGVAMAGLAVGKLGGRELKLSCSALVEDCSCGCGDDDGGEPMPVVEGQLVHLPDRRPGLLVARKAA